MLVGIYTDSVAECSQYVHAELSIVDMGESDSVQCVDHVIFGYSLFELTYHERWDDCHSISVCEDLIKIALLDHDCLVRTDIHTLAAVDTPFGVHLSFPSGYSDGFGRAPFHTVCAAATQLSIDRESMMKWSVRHLIPLRSMQSAC